EAAGEPLMTGGEFPLGERAAAVVSSPSSPPHAANARVVRARNGNRARAVVINSLLPSLSLPRPTARARDATAQRPLAALRVDPHARPPWLVTPLPFGRVLEAGGFASPPFGGFALVSAASLSWCMLRDGSSSTTFVPLLEMRETARVSGVFKSQECAATVAIRRQRDLRS